MQKSVAEILAILASGQVDKLIGTLEDGEIDAKNEPYQVNSSDKAKQDLAKQELAKDVSALANSRSGLILIGFRTEINPMVSGEFIGTCRPFESNLVNTAQYSELVAEWVRPAIAGLVVKWHPTSEDRKKGVVAIAVPPDAVKAGPYLVTRSVNPGGKVRGSVIGFYERIGDRSVPTSVEMLRSQLWRDLDSFSSPSGWQTWKRALRWA